MSACAGRRRSDPARKAARAAVSLLAAILLGLPGEAAAGEITVPLTEPQIPREGALAAVRQWSWAGGALIPLALDVDPSGGVWGIEGRGHQLFLIDDREEGGIRAAGGGEGPGGLDFAARLFARSGLKIFTLDPWKATLCRYDLNGVREERIELAASLTDAGEGLGEAVDFCLSPSGDLYLLDGPRQRILQFDGAARFQEIIGEAEGIDLRGPAALDIDGYGRIFVLTTRPAGLGVIEPRGVRFRWEPLLPGAQETAVQPVCLAVDAWGNAFVGDAQAGSVLVRPSGSSPWRLAPGEGGMQPADLAWEREGRLLVADASGAKIWIFALRYGPQGAAGGVDPGE
jgi:hypothetical protein